MSDAVRFHRVRVVRDEPRLDDVAGATDETLRACAVVPPHGDVAIAIGSRGIADLPIVVARVIEWVRANGGEPFLVPAMGSHGGATARGQADVLAAYGFVDGWMGCAVRSSMDVVAVAGHSDLPVPVVTDAHAAAAAATILVNRVKQHTDFHGPYESGLMKMAAIGLGKQVEAEALHAHGTFGLRELMPRVARHVLANSNILVGVGIVENALDQTLAVRALPAPAIADGEPELLALATTHAGRLPVDHLDVLLIDRMGKDISGVGIDTNVIGRVMINGEPDPPSPRIAMIAVHELTAASHGNATGMGLADVVTRRLAEAIDHDVTRTNIVTSGFLLRGKLPVVADDDAQAWELCLRGAGVVDPSTVRAARITDTLHCHDLWVTDAVLADLDGRADIEVVERSVAVHSATGALAPFSGA
jgi:hypothetical protein